MGASYVTPDGKVERRVTAVADGRVSYVVTRCTGLDEKSPVTEGDRGVIDASVWRSLAQRKKRS